MHSRPQLGIIAGLTSCGENQMFVNSNAHKKTSTTHSDSPEIAILSINNAHGIECFAIQAGDGPKQQTFQPWGRRVAVLYTVHMYICIYAYTCV